ncbi:hypothetical protein BGW38_003732 [Lunasporangiospora selenospora]|uniref:SAM domain-containing protein n=1 Tax=Lunasporangiospora selenospora TaxID=979761 RepID=A0A9P6FQ73_9FUNG|nr:hypothetical protein BGW38_003732 [Lunasporangiospora selenospora]
MDHADPILTSTTYFRKVNVPLEYPPTSAAATKAYVYPPPMSPSDEYFQTSLAQQMPASPPSGSTIAATQPISIPNRPPNRRRSSASIRNSLPSNISSLPSPPVSPWKPVSGPKPLTRSATMVVDATPYPDLPKDVREWTSTHVAEYLGYSLRFYPRAITEDLGRYVRQSACLTGAQFIDLKEEDLERMEINLKWRTMIMKAVGMLRRETMRASTIHPMRWEDGFDPAKDTSPSGWSSVESFHDDHDHDEVSSSVHHSTSASASAFTEKTIITAMPMPMDLPQDTRHTIVAADLQDLRLELVQDLTQILHSWKQDHEARLRKEVAARSASSLGFMEGVVIGGLIVAFMMRFSR